MATIQLVPWDAGAFTIADDAATPGTVGLRDASGNFTAKAITGTNLVSSGRLTLPFVTKTVTFTVDATSVIYLCDATSGAITVNLPAAAGVAGMSIIVKKIDSSGNNVTLDGNGTETIDGATTAAISTQYTVLKIFSDGTTWWKW